MKAARRLSARAPWANAYFTIVSPLYYSDGTGTAAVAASAGTYLHFFDRYPDNSDGIIREHRTEVST